MCSCKDAAGKRTYRLPLALEEVWNDPVTFLKQEVMVIDSYTNLLFRIRRPPVAD